MTAPTNIDDALEQNALGPKKSKDSEGREIEQHSLKEQMEYANKKTAETAASKDKFGLRMSVCVPGGAN